MGAQHLAQSARSSHWQTVSRFNLVCLFDVLIWFGQESLSATFLRLIRQEKKLFFSISFLVANVCWTEETQRSGAGGQSALSCGFSASAQTSGENGKSCLSE
jgi:hypothetical protein